MKGAPLTGCALPGGSKNEVYEHRVFVYLASGGPEETRTLDLSDANRTLSQLSYRPMTVIFHRIGDYIPDWTFCQYLISENATAAGFSNALKKRSNFDFCGNCVKGTGFLREKSDV